MESGDSGPLGVHQQVPSRRARRDPIADVEAAPLSAQPRPLLGHSLAWRRGQGAATLRRSVREAEPHGRIRYRSPLGRPNRRSQSTPIRIRPCWRYRPTAVATCPGAQVLDRALSGSPCSAGSRRKDCGAARCRSTWHRPGSPGSSWRSAPARARWSDRRGRGEPRHCMSGSSVIPAASKITRVPLSSLSRSWSR